ncbi:MAG: roadblock/LC7 domain-containing protein [Gemmatimonadales bacterium]
MTDDIRSLTAELAREPESLVFLELGELLRERGQLESAAKVTVAGLDVHPQSAQAHDLYGRILVDMGQLQRAYDEWMTALELDSRSLGARKGLGFLCYRWGDLDGALEHLEAALAVNPDDSRVVRALKMVREAAARTSGARDSVGRASALDGLGKEAHGVLLLDVRGRLLDGELLSHAHESVAEEVAAHIAAGAREADRAARILGLGAWEWVIVEGDRGNIYVNRPSDDALLVVVRGRHVPVGRLALIADNATGGAQKWLAAQGR